jgi:hypothetical protein
MLGVRRTSVTEVARKMQDKGIITYTRGVIRILDREALERLSCECYEVLIEQEATLQDYHCLLTMRQYRLTFS